MSTLTQPNFRRQVVKVRVNDAELAYLRHVAERDDRTISYVLRRALREYREREQQTATEEAVR